MILDENISKSTTSRLTLPETLPPEYVPSPSPSHASTPSLHHSPYLEASSSSNASSPSIVAQPPPRVVIARGDGEDETVLTAELSEFANAPPEVVLSWAGANADDMPELIRQSRLLDSGLPPDYESSKKITTNTTFTFSPSSSNTMLLLPPPSAQDSRPLFNVHISVNCFNPSSLITTIRRGGSPDNGEYVGEFEMGVSSATSTVTIGQIQKPLSPGVLEGWRGSKRSSGTYSWCFDRKSTKHQLRWTHAATTLTCHLHGTRDAIAVFRVPPLTPRSDGNRHPPTTLELWPRAYNDPALLAQVVVSALVLERKRLTPVTDVVN